MEETTVNNTTPQNGMNPMIWIVLIVVLVLIGGAFMFMNNKSTKQTASTTEMTMTQAPTMAPTEAMMQATGTMMKTSTTPAMTPSGTMTDTKTIDMEAGSYYYNPKTITVKKGQKVVINFKAVDMIHNFNIDELNVHGSMTKSGDTSTVEFTADKAGTFEYYCSVGNHRKMGQVGSIIVQ